MHQSLHEFDNYILKIQEDFSASLNFNELELLLRDAFYDLADKILLPVLQAILDDREKLLPALKQLAAAKGMRFCGFRKTSVRIFTGRTLSIFSPYFVRAQSKRKRKRAPNGSGSHLGLEVLGFIERTSANLASNAIQLAIICPSFEIARKVLREQGIVLDIKTIRRLCKKFGNGAMTSRGKISYDGEPMGLKDITVLICMDGGRLRERRKKRGRKPNSLKRQGYHTDWVEPKLLTIQFLDANGKLCKDMPPIYDATLGKIDDFYDLLYKYLRELNLKNAGRIVFCADGAPCLWKRIPDLMSKLNLPDWHEILDYTHAKQNLHKIAEMIPPSFTEYQKIFFEYWKDLMWYGKFDELRLSIESLFSTPKNRKQALKKFDNYFVGNQDRMQYAFFKKQNLPTGSGAVESAIRRVINLRIKGAGIFWTAQMAEVMLFLRSQFLCGRWAIVLKNFVCRARNFLKQYWTPMHNSSTLKLTC